MAYQRPMCNCPDATQSQNRNLFSSFQSRMFDRNWNSRTTSQGVVKPFPGIRDRGGYCEHELAVLNIREEIDDAFPTGIPYQPRIDGLPPRKKPVQRYQSDSLFIGVVKEIDV